MKGFDTTHPGPGVGGPLGELGVSGEQGGEDSEYVPEAPPVGEGMKPLKDMFKKAE